MKKRPHRLSPITQLKYRWYLRRAVWSKPAVGLVSAPEPRTIGSFERGQQLVSGRVLITGHIMDLGDGSVWSLPPPSDLFAAELHGFGWLCMALDGFGWLQMALDGSGWLWMAVNGGEWLWMVVNACEWLLMVVNGG